MKNRKMEKTDTRKTDPSAIFFSLPAFLPSLLRGLPLTRHHYTRDYLRNNKRGAEHFLKLLGRERGWGGENRVEGKGGREGKASLPPYPFLPRVKRHNNEEPSDVSPRPLYRKTRERGTADGAPPYTSLHPPPPPPPTEARS